MLSNDMSLSDCGITEGSLLDIQACNGDSDFF